MHNKLLTVVLIGTGLFIGAIIAPITYIAASEWWSAREIALLVSGRILDPRWEVVNRTENSISVHSWGMRYRSPECRFLGIEVMAISPKKVLRPTTVSRPGGIELQGTIPPGKYDTGVWTVELPSGYDGAIGVGLYECSKGDLTVQARATMFHIPPEVSDATAFER